MSGAAQSALPELFEQGRRSGPRCVKASSDRSWIKECDVVEADDADARRKKWNIRALHIRYLECFSGGVDCRRCGQSFLDALNNPMGPWAP